MTGSSKIVRLEPKRSLRERVARKIEPTAWGIGPDAYGIDITTERGLRHWQGTAAFALRLESLQTADEVIDMVLAGSCSGGDAA